MIQKEAANQIQSISLALQGFLLGLLLIYPAQISINLFGLKWGLLFLPVVTIFYWQRQASFSWSIICVFLLGLIFDIISAGPLGLWALSFVALYLVLGPSPRPTGGVLRDMFGYFLCVSSVFILAMLLGRVFLGLWPQIAVLMLNAVASIAVFPILYWVRSLALALRGNAVVSGTRG